MAGALNMDEVEVAGLRIAYERAGAGPPLVLLHGAPSDGREWRHQLDHLSDEYTVVAWDAPGSGRSSDAPEAFRLPDYADCLAGFTGALAIERAHVCGLSFGSALALELYRRHPTVPTTLVLASAYAGWAGSLPAETIDARMRQILRDVEVPGALERAWIPTLFTESAPAEVVDEYRTFMSDVTPAGIRTRAHALAEADLRDVLPRIDVPTLLLYGDLDVRSPLNVAHELQAAIPGSNLVVIDGVGHQNNIEAAERFTDEVRRFLRSVQA